MMAIVPQGLTTIGDALDEVGRALCGSEWLGTEREIASNWRGSSPEDEQARERYNRARTDLHRRLEQGHYCGVYVANDGRLMLLDPRNWLRDDAEWALDNAKWPDRSRPRTSKGARTMARPLYVQMTAYQKPAQPKAEPDPLPEARYLSPFMQMMLRAIEHFGVTDQPKPSLKKDELVAYFRKQRMPDGSFISENHAKAMATFIRPPEAMRGGQKRVG